MRSRPLPKREQGTRARNTADHLDRLRSATRSVVESLEQRLMMAGNPAVTGAQFIDSASGGGQRLVFTFDADVGGSLSTADLLVQNQDTGATVGAAKLAVAYEPATRVAVFSFPGLSGGLLADGNYRAILRADDVSAGGLALDGDRDGIGGDDAVFAFSFLRGDVNRDRKVDAADVSLVSASVGTAGVRPEDGDFTGDGRVDFADLVVLAQHYNGPATRLADGDVNLDGFVDFDDLVVLAQHYNATGVGDLNGDGTVTAADVQIAQAGVGYALAVRPAVAADLPYDSGPSASDGVSTNVTIDGVLAAPGAVTFKVGLDATPVANFADATGDLQPGEGGARGFSYDRTRLGQLLGTPLADGSHVLRLRAYDAANNLVGTKDVAFTLDTVAPAPPTFDLAPGYAKSPGTTTFRAPALAGTAEAGSLLSLGTVTVVADGGGQFTLPNAVLNTGTNAVTLTVRDPAGNSATATKTLTRVVPTSNNQVALDWNAALLAAVQLDASAPPLASRAMAIVAAAMYDAVNAVNGSSGYLYVRVVAPAGASDVAAAAQAARDALVYLFPAQQAAFDAQLATSLAAVTDATARAKGVVVGQQVAAAVINQRKNDGATKYVEYTPKGGPGGWVPTYPMYMTALLPNFATLKPFLMTSPDQFRPAGGPTPLNAAQWLADYNQVKALGSATSTTRTADQTQVARFWADGLGTPTPAGHWNQIATQLLQARGNVNLADTARLLAQLNVAMGDAAVVAWNAKYATDFWRPITALRAGGGNAALVADANWTPLLMTPNFPEYVSGHSAYSAAAAVVLADYFGANTAFATTSPSPGVSGVTRMFASFDAAATEAAMSRIFGGIHFLTSANDGLAAGRALGQYVLQRFADLSDKSGPTIEVDNTPGAATKANWAITGTVTDNLSGVKALTGRFDNGALFDVTVDEQGRFSVSTTLATDGSADGPHVLHLTATDWAENTTGVVDYAFALDTKAPTIALTSPAGTQPITLAAGATLVGTAAGTGSNLVALSYKFDNGTAMSLTFGANGSFSQALDILKLTTGAHTLSVNATDAAGNVTTTTLNVTVPSAAPLTVTSFTPARGSGDVGATFRPQVFFSRPVNAATLTASNFYATDSAGTKLAATIVPAADGSFAWLFLTSPMPGASTVSVTVDGTTITAADGTKLDAAGAGGVAGSKLVYRFTTVSTATLAGTSLSGVVADPGPDLQPGTPDDTLAGPDGVLMTGDDVYTKPLAGVTIRIAGTALTMVTDAQGRFNFASVPSGNVKLVIEGLDPANSPAGFYFPEMVMDLAIHVGQANTVMAAMSRAGTSNAAPGAQLTTAKGVYLPRLKTSLLQTVNAGVGASIGVAAENAPTLTNEQRQAMTIGIQPGSLVGANGLPLTSAQIGISTVPASLVMDMLPPGLMQHTFDITVQARGVAAFSTPAPITFPNVFNAAPGAKLNFLSFDHTTGRLVIEGTATVSSDGKSVTSDSGTGITKPGWHGLAPPGDDKKSPPIPAQNTTKDRRTPEQRREDRKNRNLDEYFKEMDEINQKYEPSIINFFKRIFQERDASKRWEEKDKAADEQYRQETADLPVGAPPLPAPPVEDIFVRVRSALDQMAQLKAPYLTADSLPAAVQAQIDALFDNLDSEFGGDAATEMRNTIVQAENSAFGNDKIADFTAPPNRRVYYSADIVDLTGTRFTVRGRTEPDGRYNFFVGAGSEVRIVEFYDPVTNSYAVSQPYLRAGLATPLTYPEYIPASSVFSDADGDGLIDSAERIIGTALEKADSNGDGVNDFASVQQGLDPLSGVGFPTGTIATLPLQGTVKAVVVEGATFRSGDQIAYAATGSYGLAIVDVSRFDKPTVLSQLDLPGDATDVAVDFGLGIAAVASNSGGLILVNVSNPQQPTVIKTISINASQVEVRDGVVYAAAGGTLSAYDLVTGDWLQNLSVGAGTINGLAREGAYLYTLDSNRVLRAIDVSGPSMVAKGSLGLPAGTGQLFVGNGIAYAGATQGFVTANVSNPNALTLISGVDATNIAGRAVVANGSGLGVGVANLGFGIGNVLHVLNVSNPANTNAFLTQYTLPQDPYAVALASGIAYVADGTGGLIVVNYRAFDNLGVAPTVNIDTAGLDSDPGAAGIQVVEGTAILVKVTIADDVQVRNVELLVNGQVVRNDVSFPFDLTAVLPSLASLPTGQTTVTVQVRATDTGGNVTTTAPLTLNLVPDTTAPQVVATNPPNNAIRGQNFRTIQINFSEGIDAATVTAANFVLKDGNNVAYAPTNIQIRNNGSSVQLTFAALAPGNYTLTLNSAAIKDRAGNAMGLTSYVTHFTVKAATAVFSNLAGGFWDDPNNWDTQQVPGPNDDVLIELPAGSTVTLRQGTVSVKSLTSFNAFTLLGGTLAVSGNVQINATFLLAGGTLKDARIVRGIGTGAVLNLGPGRLTGVTLAADATFASGNGLYVNGGLTLEGGATLTVGPPNGTNDYAYLYFEGTQTLGGTGTVVMRTNSNGYYGLARQNQNGTTLTIGSGVTVRGQTGEFGDGTHSIVNNGTIVADVPGRELRVLSASFTNNGTLRAAGGGLTVNGLITNSGTISPGGDGVVGGTISVSGTFIQTAAGSIRVDIGGATPGTQFDRLTITGSATLGGTLFVKLVNGYAPPVGTAFQVVTYGSRIEASTFATVTDLDPGDGSGYVVGYGTTGATLTTVAGGAPAEIVSTPRIAPVRRGAVPVTNVIVAALVAKPNLLARPAMEGVTATSRRNAVVPASKPTVASAFAHGAKPSSAPISRPAERPLSLFATSVRKFLKEIDA